MCVPIVCVCVWVGGWACASVVCVCVLYVCLHVCVAWFPGLLTPAFVTCSTNAGEGLVKLVTCSDVGGRMEEWHVCVCACVCWCVCM